MSNDTTIRGHSQTKQIPLGVSLKSWAKAAIIKAYWHGLVPAMVTEWSIQKGKLRHD